jgi:hypothetical protein
MAVRCVGGCFVLPRTSGYKIQKCSGKKIDGKGGEHDLRYAGSPRFTLIALSRFPLWGFPETTRSLCD